MTPFVSSADFFEDEAVHHLLKYKPWWVKAYAKKMASQENSSLDEESQTALGTIALLHLGLLLFNVACQWADF